MSIQELYNLQELDLIIGEKQETLDAVRAEIGDESNLRAARQRLANLEAQHTARNALRRDAQLQVDQLESRESAVQNRLYGGAITNPRELEAFQEELAMLGRQKSEAEDVLLERMVETEDLQEALDRMRQVAATLEQRRSERMPQLSRQAQALSGEIDALNLRRADMLPQIAPPLLATYETLRASRSGQAVSKIEHARGSEICGACRVALPRSDSQRIRSGAAIVQCNNCRRILYLE